MSSPIEFIRIRTLAGAAVALVRRLHTPDGRIQAPLAAWRTAISCLRHPGDAPRGSKLLGQSVYFRWTWPPAGIDVGLGDVVSGVHVAMQVVAEVVRVSS